jgi:hypothetical protein
VVALDSIARALVVKLYCTETFAAFEVKPGCLLAFGRTVNFLARFTTHLIEGPSTRVLSNTTASWFD